MEIQYQFFQNLVREIYHKEPIRLWIVLSKFEAQKSKLVTYSSCRAHQNICVQVDDMRSYKTSGTFIPDTTVLGVTDRYPYLSSLS